MSVWLKRWGGGGEHLLQVLSPTKIRVEKISYSDRDAIRNRDSVWAFEPGPLKVVAIDIGDGLVHLNPKDGGVVVAAVKNEIKVQANESLRIYRSTKQIQVAGSGFTDKMSVSVLFADATYILQH